MDTHELRQAFLTSDHLPQQLRNLHATAVERSSGKNFPFQTRGDPTAVVSLIPMSMFREKTDFVINDENALCYVKPSGGISGLETLDGVVMFAPLDTERRTRAYALTHRTGMIESSWTIGRRVDMNGKEQSLVWPKNFFDSLVDVVLSGVTRQRSYGLDGPWAVLATIKNFQGFRLVLGDHYQSEPAWQNEAHLPELTLENPNEAALVPLAKAIYWIFGEAAPQDKF